MTDPFPTPDPKESTEAKLCAYLEGELAPADRAEIEQHLAAHPQHRKLLVDLAKTREWMRSIPRETAPADLAESFQGQVERSMLLDDSDREGLGTGTRWPQLAMMAAIVVLTLGLGVTLFMMLKGPTGGGPTGGGPIGGRDLAISNGTSNSTTPSSTSPPATKPTVMTDEKSIALLGGAPAPRNTSPSPVSVATAPSLVADAAGDNHINVVQPLGSRARELDVAEIKTRLSSSGYRAPVDARTICFVVQSDTPATTVEQVRGFFIRHQLLVEEPAGLSDKLPAGDAAPAGAVASGQSTPPPAAAAYASNGAAPAAPERLVESKNNATKNDGGKNDGDKNDGGKKSAQQDQVVRNQAQSQPSNHGGQNQLGQNQNTKDELKKNAAANTQSNSLSVVNESNSQNANQISVNQSGQMVYVAHGLTPLQLELLNASLAANNSALAVRRLTLSEGNVLARAVTPLSGTIGKGQLLTVTIPQLVGPGIETTNVVKVAEDGNITLPMIDPLPAVDLTPGDLAQRIATKYREGNLIPNATVTVAAGPTTQPASQPTSQALAKAIMTTQPINTLSATQPVRDPGIDVVVVIENAK